MLFEGLTALFCPRTSSTTRQAFVEAGGSLASEQSVLESRPIDAYVGAWGEEDVLATR
jgi:hypothetical protein